MASSIFGYPAFGEHILRGTIDIDSDPIKIALFTSGYTPNDTNDAVFADLGANEIAAQGGYILGGKLVVNPVVTRTPDETKFDCDDMEFLAVGGTIPTWRWAIVYADVTRNAKVHPLIARILGDDTPANVPAIPDGSKVVIRVNPNGFFTI